MKSIHIVADENILGLRECLDWVTGLNCKLEVFPGREINPQNLKNADVLLVRSVTQVNQSLLEGSAVSFVGSATTGLEHIDEACLAKKGIQFCSAFGVNANAVAEYVMSCLAWISQKDSVNYFEKSVGIVGFGNVGKALFSKLKALGATCLVYDPYLSEKSSEDHSAMSFVSWEEIECCEVLSFHVPYTQSGTYPTHAMMNAEFFGQLKRGAVIINAARGEICDEKALLQAIEQKSLKCVLDVWQHEPAISLPLLDKVVLATPHIAGYSFDAKLNATRILVENMVNFLSKENSELVFSDKQAEPNTLITLNADDVMSSILEAYNPETDSQKLKSGKEHDVARIFDSMRKQYQHRAQWKHFVIKKGVNEKVFNTLSALGFSSD